MRRRSYLYTSTAVAVGLPGCPALEDERTSADLADVGGIDGDDGNGDDTDTDNPDDDTDPEHREVSIFDDGTVDFADPYAGVDWADVGRHKGQFHVHPHYGDIGPPQDVYDRYLELGYDLINVQPKVDLDREMPWPPEEMGELHDDWESRHPAADGVVALPGVDYENPQHLVGLFTTLMRGDEGFIAPGGLASPDVQYQTAREIIDAGSTPESDVLEPLVFRGRPGRHRGGEFWDDEWDGEWLSHYDRLFDVDPVLGLEAITYAFGYDDRDLWDHLLEAQTPRRPIIGTSTDDAGDLENADRGWVTFYLSDEEFDPSDQLSSMESIWQAFVGGRTSFSTVAEPGAEAPIIEAIDHDADAGSITIDGADYDDLEWVSHGEVIATGETLDYADEGRVGDYVRAQLIEGDPADPTAITCTQAWHL